MSLAAGGSGDDSDDDQEVWSAMLRTGSRAFEVVEEAVPPAASAPPADEDSREEGVPPGYQRAGASGIAPAVIFANGSAPAGGGGAAGDQSEVGTDDDAAEEHLGRSYSSDDFARTTSANAILRAQQVLAAAHAKSGGAAGADDDAASGQLRRLNTPDRLSLWQPTAAVGARGDEDDDSSRLDVLCTEVELAGVVVPSSVVTSVEVIQAFMDKVDEAARELVPLRAACDGARAEAMAARAAVKAQLDTYVDSVSTPMDGDMVEQLAAAEQRYSEACESLQDGLLRKALLVQQLSLVTVPRQQQGALPALEVSVQPTYPTPAL
jgi:hypothetical protein